MTLLSPHLLIPREISSAQMCPFPRDCQALAVWVAVIYVSGMVGIGGILGRDRGREQSCLSGLVITLGLGERLPLPSGQPLAPVAVDIHVHENEKSVSRWHQPHLSAH